jgi:hypothetical protein
VAVTDPIAPANQHHHSDNPVVPMKPRSRALIALGVTLLWLFLMIGMTAGADWRTGAFWLRAGIAVTVFAAGLLVMLRVRHAPAAVAICLALTLTSVLFSALMTGGL